MKLNALNCPNCGAAYDPKQYRCDYCGSVIIMSNDNYIDLTAKQFEPRQVREDKYPGIYVFGRLLGAGEKPIALGEANMMHGLTAAGGKLLLTNRSLSFSAHLLNIGKKSAVIRLEDITDVRLAANMIVSQHITVRTKDDNYRFVVFNGQEWVEKIKKAIEDLGKDDADAAAAPSAKSPAAAPSAKSPAAAPSAVASGDYSEELRKLKALLDEGIITEDEYAIKKRQILGI